MSAKNLIFPRNITIRVILCLYYQDVWHNEDTVSEFETFQCGHIQKCIKKIWTKNMDLFVYLCRNPCIWDNLLRRLDAVRHGVSIGGMVH